MFAFEDVHWYYIDDAKNDAQIGPFVISQLKELFEQGVVKTDTYC